MAVKCRECGGDFEDETELRMRIEEDGVQHFHVFSALCCNNCGEIAYRGDVAERIQREGWARTYHDSTGNLDVQT